MDTSDPLYTLWVAVHDYLVAQAAVGPEAGAALARAYAALVEAHNSVHAGYFFDLDAAPVAVGVTSS